MKRLFTGLVCVVISTTTSLFSQNVAINTTGAVANNAAMLDVDATNKGLLIPRVALTATNSNAPVGATVVTSLMVYNTATASAGATAVTPGYYFWDGTQWVRLFNTGNAWQTGGNYGTNPGTNYAGTADAQDFAIRTSATERMRITAGGNLGIGTTTPGVKVDIVGAGNTTLDLRVNGRIQTGDAGGNGGVWLNSANDGFVGNAGANIGFWVTSVGWNAFQIVKATGNVGIGTTTPAYTFHTVSTGIVAGYVQNTNAANDAFWGINSAAAGVNTSAGVVGMSYQASTLAAGVWGENPNATGTATVGGGNGVGISMVAGGSGGAFTGLTTGEFANSTTAATGQAIYTTQFGSVVRVNFYNGTQYKINGVGAVSCMVPDLQNNWVTMHCAETPEFYYSDYGQGQLVNGVAHIDLDPILAKNVAINDKHPLRVFIQLEDNEFCKGVVVKNKTATGFDVVELDGGTSNTPFQWNVVCNAADMDLPNGKHSKFADLRFEPAEKELEITGPVKKDPNPKR